MGDGRRGWEGGVACAVGGAWKIFSPKSNAGSRMSRGVVTFYVEHSSLEIEKVVRDVWLATVVSGIPHRHVRLVRSVRL